MIRSNYELEYIGDGKFKHTQYLKPIAYPRDGSWSRILNALFATGDQVMPVGVDELLEFRIRDRLAGASPLMHFGKGKSHVRLTPMAMNNVNGIVAGNKITFPSASDGADLVMVVGGHYVRADWFLSAGHPEVFQWRVDSHGGFDPETMMFGDDFRFLQPVLKEPAVNGEIQLKWDVTKQGGKYYLTCELPAGDYSGWVLDPTLTLQPDETDGEDTYIDKNDPNANFETGASMRVGERDDAADNVSRALVKFDLTSIPSNANISSAVFTLYVNAEKSSNARDVKIFRSLEAWVEAEATWNIYSTGNNWGTAGGFNATDHEQSEIASENVGANPSAGSGILWSLNLAKVTEWIDGTLTNNGFMVKADTELNDQVRYRSSSHATTNTRPKISIFYTIPSGAAMARSPMWGRY